MKNLLVVLFVLFSCISTYSQSITQDWFFKDGQISKNFAVSNVGDLIAPEAGVDKIWDFSNAIAASDTLYEFFVGVQSLQHLDQYPNTDLGRLTGSLEFYFDITEDDIIVDGLYANENVSLTYPGGFPIGHAYSLNEPKEREYDIITYNHLTMDTISAVYSISTTLELTGAGTVVTPEGSYANCILQKRTRIYEDEIVFESWAFYKDQYSNQVATLNKIYQDNNQFDLTFTYQTDLEEFLSGTEEIDFLDWEVYAVGQDLLIHSDEEHQSVDLQILDISGKVLQKQHQAVDQGENVLQMTTPSLAGHYVLFVLDKETGEFRSFKFWVGG